MKQQLVNQQLNFIGKEVKDGHLYLKFYVADSSLNPSIGQLSKDSLLKVMPTGVSRPYVLTDGKTKFPGNNPWHPYSSDPNPIPTLEKEIQFAKENYGIGECVMMTPFSELKRGAAVNPELAALGIQDDGWFAVMDVTDPVAKQSFIDDDGLIPPQISIGFLVHQQDRHKFIIDNYDIAHFAACPKGSYGDKTHYWKSCIGEKGICLDALRGAAAAVSNFDSVSYSSQTDVKSNLENIKKLDENNIYDVDVNESKNSMVADDKENSDSKDQKEIPTDVDTSKNKESKNDGQEESKEKSTQKQTNNDNDVSPKSEKAESNNKNPDSNADVQKQLNELKASIEAKEAITARREELRTMVPTELFKDMKEWESEIETRLKQNLSDEVIKEIYDTKLAALKLSNMKAESIGQPSNGPFGENEQSSATPSADLGVHRGAAKGDNEGAVMIAKSLLLCSQNRSIKPERSN